MYAGAMGADSGSVVIGPCGTSQGTINVLGSVVGGNGDGSGIVSCSGAFSDGCKRITIGSNVVGGSGDHSGSIDANDRAIAIRGSVIGGSGSSSGEISLFTMVRVVKIDGSVTGGEGDQSAAVLLGSIEILPSAAALLGAMGSTPPPSRSLAVQRTRALRREYAWCNHRGIACGRGWRGKAASITAPGNTGRITIAGDIAGGGD